MARQGDTLENPATGERLVFRRATADSGGALLSFAFRLELDRWQSLRAQARCGASRRESKRGRAIPSATRANSPSRPSLRCL